MKIRNELLSQVRSYAGHTPHAAADTLDCSLGVNPYGFPPVVREALPPLIRSGFTITPTPMRPGTPSWPTGRTTPSSSRKTSC